MSTAATVVELAVRLEDARPFWRVGNGVDLDQFAGLGDTLSPAELARVANRLRDAIDATMQLGRGFTAPAAVPAEPLGEVWDARPRVWDHNGTVRTITAVSVVRTYVETYQRGAYEVPSDLFGAQVIARSATAGEPDVFAVFWLSDLSSSWHQVTMELTADEMATWDGLKRIDDVRTTAAMLTSWLDEVAADVNAVHPSPWGTLTRGDAR